MSDDTDAVVRWLAQAHVHGVDCLTRRACPALEIPLERWRDLAKRALSSNEAAAPTPSGSIGDEQ